ncbi:4264_t:CDS:1 [Funneliformis geosporum]|uniref:10449_t:CDS:1 n=1 Tax=Funneliformis geosporum TaxID=1117311 RepID=A0A9W4SLX4_9GLOM|nr:4264_t:CDS:1 [Funneliformis geosporum]CAI2174248.1 10449_t:CDS:1 [Funneliformis geosporum]
MYQNPGIQPELSSDTFYPSYDFFSTTRDNNLNNPYTTAPINNDDYSTTSFANDSSYTPQSIGNNSNGQQILEQNPPTIIPPHINTPIHSPSMTNASSSQIQTVEIFGYEIIIIPTSSPLASLISLDVQNQLQRGNTYSPYSVNPPQLNQELDYTFATNGFDTTLQYLSQPPQSNASSPQFQTVEIPGYKIIIIPTSSPLASSTNLDLQHQLQQGNISLDYSSYSVNPPQLNRDQHYVPNAGETSISPNVIDTHNFVQDNTQPQHQQQII